MMKTTNALRLGATTLAIAALTACSGNETAMAPAPEDPARAAAATITADQIGAKIDALAADSMAGRDTPSPELEKAATWIADRLRDAGLQPAGEDGSYIDRYEYSTVSLVPEATELGVVGSDSPPSYAVDYFLVAPPSPVEATAFYMGVAGEAGPPPAEARGKVLIYQHPGTELNQEWQQRLGAALQPAMMSGAPAVLFILAPDFPAEQIQPLASATARQQAPFALAGVTHEAGSALVAELGADLSELEAAGEPTALGGQAIGIEATRTETMETPPNVVAMLPGSDPELSDSYVVLTAHFDHVGVGEPNEDGDSIYNGADDDASGTAAILEIAEAFGALDEAPARSVVFLLVSGEEDGLLGSMAWVQDPTVDLSGVAANVNMDMVGRNAPDTLIGIGQEYSTLEDVLAGITADHPELGLNVILDPQPEENFFFRSDQLAFIQQDIPAVFFTTGLHDEYHEQTDEAALIDDDKAARIARLGFYLAYTIAQDPVAPTWTEEGEARIRQMLQGGM